MIFFNHPGLHGDVMRLLEAFDKTLGNDNDFEIDVYPTDAPDDEWMTQAGKRKPMPFILTFDIPSIRNKVERLLLQEYNCNFIWFKRSWADQNWQDYVSWRLVKHWPKILKQAEKARDLSLIEVNINGRCSLERL